MARELHYRWEWRLESSPERLWPLVADTNRFNRDNRGPVVGELGTTAEGRRRLEVSVAGRRLPYEETPFEWVRPERFGVTRRYAAGPLAELRALVELEQGERGGTVLVYRIWAHPRGPLGRLLVAHAIGVVARRRFDRTFRRYDRVAAGSAPPRRAAEAVLAPGGRERIARLRDAVAGAAADPDLARRLVDAVERGEALDLARMRPYACADDWGADRRRTLELFLHATRAGLLESRWELLCPHCRGAVEARPSLAELALETRCDACAVDVTADLERSVELVFRPSPAVREVDAAAYCVGGPGVTPHVVAQQSLAPHESRPLALALEPGRYRLRARGVPGAVELVADPRGAAEAAFAVGAEGWANTEATVSLRPSLVIASRAGSGLLVDLERTAWSDRATTAADVTVLQAFRDLFATEALRPGAGLAVTSITLAFTDLRESTRLYRQVGDAPAYGSVAEHFDVLRAAIAAEGGAIVKTIGDAVMAAFRRPVAAVRALAEAQRALADPPEGRRPLQLKVGIHEGPCLAVTLNGRLDYFGSTVNAAARIVGLSSGTDVVVSAAVRSDPEVAELLERAGVVPEPVEASLRGFEGEPLALWRLHPRG